MRYCRSNYCTICHCGAGAHAFGCPERPTVEELNQIEEDNDYGCDDDTEADLPDRADDLPQGGW